MIYYVGRFYGLDKNIFSCIILFPINNQRADK